MNGTFSKVGLSQNSGAQEVISSLKETIHFSEKTNGTWFLFCPEILRQKVQPGALDLLLEVFELLLVDGWNFTKMLLFLWPDLASVGLPWDLLVEALFVFFSFFQFSNRGLQTTRLLSISKSRIGIDM